MRSALRLLAVLCLAALAAAQRLGRVIPIPEVDYSLKGVPKSSAQVRQDGLNILATYGSSSPAYVRTAVADARVPAVVRQAAVCTTGSASKICLYHATPAGAMTVEQTTRYVKAKTVFEEAASIWADSWPSAVEVRILANWAPLDPRILGSAGPPTLFLGNTCGTESLGANLYSPAVINALRGVDFDDGSGTLPHHVVMTMNSAFPTWSFGRKGVAPAPSEYDLLSTVLHEIGHGLFFISFSNANAGAGTANFVSGFGFRTTTGAALTHRTLNRFDKFMTNGARSPMLNFCGDDAAFYKQLTSGVRFYDSRASSPTDFRLYAPTAFEPGSSTSHFIEDSASLRQDCTANGLNPDDPTKCSALMTPQQANGEYSHSIGENTLRVMRSMLGSSPGFVGTCKFNPWVNNF